jgi:ABC-type bacteriocin/lantibiotic exporter with double-glycine peptidase domain
MLEGEHNSQEAHHGLGEEGHIVEQGIHEELLATQGLYAELYNSQFRRQA